MKLEELEMQLRDLLKGKCSSLSLTFNDECAPNYQTVEQWCGPEGPPEDMQPDWVSLEEKEQAIARNSMWTLQWYPNTPVGFNRISASSLPAIFAYLEAISENA